MLFTVALTGGIGSGKSTVANAFAALGVEIIDADVIAREVVELGTPALQAIVQRTFQPMRTSEGKLYRARLREIIFQQPQEKNWLNQLLHPLINARTQQLRAQASSSYVLWVVPLLIDNNLLGGSAAAYASARRRIAEPGTTYSCCAGEPRTAPRLRR